MNRINSIFREVFNDDSIVVFPKMQASNISEWDSFNHIQLIVALEDKFKVTFTTDEITDMVNVDSLVKILQQKGVDVHW